MDLILKVVRDVLYYGDNLCCTALDTIIGMVNVLLSKLPPQGIISRYKISIIVARSRRTATINLVYNPQ